MAEILAANQITIAKVLDGEKGIPGEKGADGKTSYFHIKYSAVANPTSSSEMSETPLAYIGTYVDFTEADSTDPTKYTWSRFEGIQGEKGEQGIPGVGQDGKTSYLHIAYATSADGSEGFSVTESANKTYIGQYTDFVSTDSTDYTKYSWTKIKGEMSAEQLAQLNQASEDALQAKSDVANLEIGGRNYIIESDEYISETKYKSVSLSLEQINNLKGKEITISLDVKLENAVASESTSTSHRVGVEFWLKFEDGVYQYIGAWRQLNTDGTIINENIRISKTVKIYSEHGDITTWHGSVGNGVVGMYIQGLGSGSAVIGRPKLEIGNKATDWTPAPEDVDEGIKNAAKTATNYIHSDTTNGLVVNNNQNVGVGYDIQLKADGSNTGMNIRQNGNILASFLQNSVSLGKNSINSKVGMCGDKGGVSASFGYYVDSVTSNNAEMGSTLSFDFNETTFKNKVGQTTGFYEFTYTSAGGWKLFDPVNDTSYAVTLSQYGITMKTPTSSIKDHAGITINYTLDGSVKFYNADISNPVRKLELEIAENPSSSESDFANITIERQSGTYASGDGKEHSIITMMTLHEFANAATLQLFDDEISLNASHLYLTSSYGYGSIQLDGDTNINGNLVVQGYNLVSKIQAMLCAEYPETLTVTDGTFTNNGCSAVLLGNSLRLGISAKAKAAITAGNIPNQTMLTITFVDDKIASLYSVGSSGASAGPNSQMEFTTSGSGGQHTIKVSLAAIAQSVASGGVINAFVSIPCVLNWDAY